MQKRKVKHGREDEDCRGAECGKKIMLPMN